MTRRYLEDREAMALMSWASMTQYAGKHVSDFLIHIPNQGARHPRTGAKFKRMGMRPGIPDYFLHVPTLGERGAPIGGLWIELKSNETSANPTEMQDQQLLHLAACGYRTCWVRGWENAARAICQYLGIRCSVTLS